MNSFYGEFSVTAVIHRKERVVVSPGDVSAGFHCILFVAREIPLQSRPLFIFLSMVQCSARLKGFFNIIIKAQRILELREIKKARLNPYPLRVTLI